MQGACYGLEVQITDVKMIVKMEVFKSLIIYFKLMDSSEVRYKNKGIIGLFCIAGAVTESGGKKEIYITEALKDAPQGLKLAIEGHEKIHKRTKDNFLNDSLHLMDNYKIIVPQILAKYRLEDLEQKLKEDMGSPFHRITEYEVAKELSDIFRQCVNLISYFETPDEETRNWIVALDYIRDEIGSFMKSKKINKKTEKKA